MGMRLHDDEIEEWHRIVYEQRNSYRRLLEDICTGIPKIYGMASEYRKMTLKEIEDRVKKLLE